MTLDEDFRSRSPFRYADSSLSVPQDASRPHRENKWEARRRAAMEAFSRGSRGEVAGAICGFAEFPSRKKNESRPHAEPAPKKGRHERRVAPSGNSSDRTLPRVDAPDATVTREGRHVRGSPPLRPDPSTLTRNATELDRGRENAGSATRTRERSS